MSAQMRQNSWQLTLHSKCGSQISIAHSIFIYVSLWNKVMLQKGEEFLRQRGRHVEMDGLDL